MKSEKEKTQICLRYLREHDYVVTRKMLSKEEVAAILGVSAPAIDSWINPKSDTFNGSFPAPYQINSRPKYRLLRWKPEDIESWLETKCHMEAA